MKIGVCVAASTTDAPNFNISQIEKYLRKAQKKCDLVLFSERFLQGAEGLCFDPIKDKKKAYHLTDEPLQRLAKMAARYKVGVGFGFFEHYDDAFYDAYVIFGKKGEVCDITRSIQKNWKPAKASKEYQKGTKFHTFNYYGLTLTCCLGTELLEEEKSEKVKRMGMDGVIWPMAFNWSSAQWEKQKELIEGISNKVKAPVFYVNALEAKRNYLGSSGCLFRGEAKRQLGLAEEGLLVWNIGPKKQHRIPSLELSCGGVIYKETNQGLTYVLIRERSGNYGLPKGHREKGETDELAAKRELYEETGMRPKIIKGFERWDIYDFGRNSVKAVHYFLADGSHQTLKPIDKSIPDALELSLNDAVETASFDHTKKILQEADRFLKKRRKELKLK